MVVHDVGKVALLIVVTFGVFLLLLFGRAEFSDVDWIIAAVVAYTTGNGVLARRGDAPSPMLVPRYPRPAEVDELDQADELDREAGQQ